MSPRMSPRTLTGDARQLTLGQLGSLLPRPEHKPSSCAGLQSQVVVSCQQTPDTQSGVVYECDGYEVFYGHGDYMVRPTVTTGQLKEKRDAFDKFYGIRSSDRCTSSPQS